MLAHVRDGHVIRVYRAPEGWVTLADGQKVSPPVAGYVNGPDRIVEAAEEVVDESTTALTVRAQETLIDRDRVILRTVVRDMPQEQRAALIRAERDDRLSASDWTQVADAPVNKEAWAAYRAALRDVTKQAGFPDLVDWPREP